MKPTNLCTDEFHIRKVYGFYSIVTAGYTVRIYIVICSMVSESNCFLRWGCPENVSMECSEDGGCNSSLTNDISVSSYTA
jgi:hypothetical protein